MHLHSVLYLASLLSLATAFSGGADVSGRTRQHRHCRALKSEGRHFAPESQNGLG